MRPAGCVVDARARTGLVDVSLLDFGDFPADQWNHKLIDRYRTSAIAAGHRVQDVIGWAPEPVIRAWPGAVRAEPGSLRYALCISFLTSPEPLPGRLIVVVDKVLPIP